MDSVPLPCFFLDGGMSASSVLKMSGRTTFVVGRTKGVDSGNKIN